MFRIFIFALLCTLTTSLTYGQIKNICLCAVSEQDALIDTSNSFKRECDENDCNLALLSKTLNGKYLLLKSDSSVCSYIEITNGKKNGIEIHFYNDGQPMKISLFEKNELLAEVKYNFDYHKEISIWSKKVSKIRMDVNSEHVIAFYDDKYKVISSINLRQITNTK